MFIFTQGIAGKEQQAVELSSSFINTSIYSTGKSKPFSNEDLVDTRSPSPRFYRLIKRKNQGHPRSVTPFRV